MGNKNKQNRQSKNNNNSINNNNNKVSSKKPSDDPPPAIENNANGVHSPSNDSTDDERRNVLNKLFPWRTSTITPQQRREEVQLRIASSSLITHSNPATLLPMLREIEFLRDNANPSIPIMPPLLMGALTDMCVRRSHSSALSFRFSQLPPYIQQEIGILADAMPELRLASRGTLKTMTDYDEPMCLSLEELSTLARIRNLFLDRAKIAKNRLLDGNWFTLSSGIWTSYANMELMNGGTTIGCHSIDLPYYARKSDSNMGHNAVFQWAVKLNKVGLPLWVYEIIRPKFTFTFKASYEPGDEILIRVGLLTRKYRKDDLVTPVTPTKTRLAHHIMQYEIVYSDMPIPILEDTSHGGPLDLCLHLTIPPNREDIIIYDFDIRCSIPTKEEFISLVADYDIQQEKLNMVSCDAIAEQIEQLNSLSDKAKAMFPDTVYETYPSLKEPTAKTTNPSTSQKRVKFSPKPPAVHGKSAARNVAGRRK